MTDPDQTWYAATAVAAPERPALTHSLDVDLCVVGAGLAGLTIAREVARRGWSVAVLDAGKVAASASLGMPSRRRGEGAGASCAKPARLVDLDDVPTDERGDARTAAAVARPFVGVTPRSRGALA